MPFGAQRGKLGAGRLSNASDSRHSPKEAKKKRLQDVGLARLQQAARGRGGECLSSECLGQAARYSFRCAAGHAWEVAGSDVLRGAWCRLCAHEQRGKQLLSPDGLGRLQQAAAARGGACLSDAYLGQGKTYRFRCMHGHEWETRGNPVLRGAWCPDCAYVEKGKRMVRPDGLARLQAVAVAKGGACLSTVYLGNAHRYQFCCWCGHEWDAIAESVCQGAWCQACARRKKRLSIEDARKAAHARGGQCLSTAYVNNSTKMSWLCDRGHVWQTAFAVVRTGKWCPTCANMARITNAKFKARQRYENAGHLGL